ncbi:MAG: AIR synthase related protein, partial [Thermodesulfovibrionales bacterium]|nr:AIR synthase related protein [Thermodesulfovibrionales bacterium]
MERIQLSHGSGGKEMHELIRKFIQPTFEIEELADSAIIPIQKLLSNSSKDRLAFTTDSYVVSPIFFPGGNIGDLAINGTINDLAMVGADPLYISLGIILEEGFLLEDLEKIVLTIANASKKAEVKVVTGDIKVVEKGKGDGIYIN